MADVPVYDPGSPKTRLSHESARDASGRPLLRLRLAHPYGNRKAFRQHVFSGIVDAHYRTRSRCRVSLSADYVFIETTLMSRKLVEEASVALVRASPL